MDKEWLNPERHDSAAYPERMRILEMEEIDTRRRIWQEVADGSPMAEAGPVGFALSGGGIRSATFCLGLFQALARAGRLDRVDFLSTVSGGGYFGAFLGRMFHNKAKNAGHAPTSACAAALANTQSPELKWLRDNGRYLAPGGSGDMWTGAATILRNWVAAIYVLGLGALTLLLALAIPSWYVTTHVYRFVLGSLVLSPWLLASLVVLLLLCLPLAWAYFLVFPRSVQGVARYVPSKTTLATVASTGLLAALAVLLALSDMILPGETEDPLKVLNALRWGPFLICIVTLGSWGLAWLHQASRGKPGPRLDEAHGWLNRCLGHFFVVLVSFSLLALLDTAGAASYCLVASNPGVLWSGLATVASMLAGLVTFGSRVAALLSDGKNSNRLRIPWKVPTSVAAGLIMILFLTAISTVAHGLCWEFQDPRLPCCCTPVHSVPWVAVATLAVLLVLAWFLGWIIPFLNYSSLHSLYSERLARAFLGASNEERCSPAQPHPASVLNDHPHDDMPMVDYRPAYHGGPIHLVNVTINETVSPKTGLTSGDQRGLGMAVSPNAISIGVGHHVLRVLSGQKDNQPTRTGTVQVFPTGGFRIFDYGQECGQPLATYNGEPLTLGQWIAISGAAFSTGLGSKTSLGVSLLCGLANVRLGYWWDSGVDPKHRAGAVAQSLWRKTGRHLAGWLPVHSYLFDEWLARFHGVNRRRWNLSDGGHFNNLGAYELVRRRLPLIVAVDAEADAENSFEALTDLIRRIRVDFCAETRFLSRSELDPLLKNAPPEWSHVIGELSDLARLPPEPDHTSTPDNQGTSQDVWCQTEPEKRLRSRAHAAVAEIVYQDRGTNKPNGMTSLMLYVKASLTGDEPADVLQYQKDHADFPHEPTADQFFDDAQWESYRALGEHVGTLLFDRRSHDKVSVPKSSLARLEWLW